MPDAVLRALAAGVRLLAVAVTESRIHSQRDRGAGDAFGELTEHVGRAAVHMDAETRDGIQAFTVEDVGGVDDRVRRGQVTG